MVLEALFIQKVGAFSQSLLLGSDVGHVWSASIASSTFSNRISRSYFTWSSDLSIPCKRYVAVRLKRLLGFVGGIVTRA